MTARGRAVVDVRCAGLPRGSWRPSRRVVARWVRSMARRAGAGPVDVSVLLVGDAAIRALNRRWRRRDRATDVLAFPPPRSRPRRRPQPRPLGDIVVSLETCRREARAAGVAACGRLAHLLAHGLLHLLGRDHATTRAFEALERRTRELAAAALGRNPPRR